MGDKLKPALIGGAIAGILSVIPLISLGCCLWTIGGGLLAGYLYIKQSPTPVTTGGGASTGTLAGVVAAVIYIVVQLLMIVAFGAMASMDEQFRKAGLQLPLTGMALGVISAIIGALIIIGLTTLGGLISVPIFEKRKNGDAPPPPVGFAA